MAPVAEGQQWSIPAVIDVVAGAIPDADMLIEPDVRLTHAEVQSRTRRLAAHLLAEGLGLRRERSELERWECGQSPVALVMSNCHEYIESMIGCYRARATCFNVNHHYRPAEVAGLLGSIGAEAVIYERRFAPLLEGDSANATRVLIDVDDDSGVEPLAGSTGFEDAIGAQADDPVLPEPSPDDIHMVCTGGTTGTPKGVLWRQGDVWVGSMGGAPDATAESIAAAARSGLPPYFPAPPLMHAAAQWTAFAGLSAGAAVVLHDDSRHFDARAILDLAERERVMLMSIVGEAFARPIVDELRKGRHDLSSLLVLATGGAATSEGTKAELLELLPHLTIIDGYGASETGAAALAASTRDDRKRDFTPAAGSLVVSEDRGRFLEPGDTETGWAARVGLIPLGYLNDRNRTLDTFPEVDGVRVAIPGDRAHFDAEGRIAMLGRDSLVINSGGEKVFVEEVEEALRRHRDIDDALVVGRPHDRFGQEVVALVELRSGAALEAQEIREIAAETVARFKAPRAVLVCDKVGRLPTGKPDYTWAREVAADAVDATTDTAGEPT